MCKICESLQSQRAHRKNMNDLNLNFEGMRQKYIWGHKKGEKLVMCNNTCAGAHQVIFPGLSCETLAKGLSFYTLF